MHEYPEKPNPEFVWAKTHQGRRLLRILEIIQHDEDNVYLRGMGWDSQIYILNTESIPPHCYLKASQLININNWRTVAKYEELGDKFNFSHEF